MILPSDFCNLLAKSGVDFFCGVPDSLLKNLCAHIDNFYSEQQHVITANEGNAVGLAIGRYLGSGKPAAVYMQNSGLGNAINPLASLADLQVYSIPMLLIIGWRGEPNVKDEPQHVKQGQITEHQLSIMGIPYVVIDATTDIEHAITPLIEKMTSRSQPVAVVVRKNTFSAPDVNVQTSATEFELRREVALSILLEQMDSSDIVISTTGKTSRELYELRQKRGENITDFLTVGGMGHTASIAMGVCLSNIEKRVVALDGDGSMLMHMGALPVIANKGCSNLIHIVLNNQCHESVGGQPTVAGDIDMEKLSLSCGYQHYYCADDQASVVANWEKLRELDGPIFFEIKIAKGARADLGRPKSTPIENKRSFMQHIGNM